MTHPTDTEHALFDALLEPYLEGEPLSVEDQSTFDHLVSTYPTYQQEVRALQALSDLDVPATPESNRIASRALNALNAPGAKADRTDRAERADGHTRFELKLNSKAGLAVTAAFAMAAAMALAFLMPRQEPLASRQTNVDIPKADQPAAQATPQAYLAINGQARVEWVYASGATRLIPYDEGAAANPEKVNITHGRLLAEGDRLESDAGAACFVLDPGINVCVDAHSQLKLAKISGQERLFELTRGRVALQLDHQPRGFSVSVQADGVLSTAVGTSFSVAKHKTGIDTTVLEGRVKVTHQRTAQAGQGPTDRTQYVDAHQRLRLGVKPAQMVTLTRTQEATEWAVIKPARLWETHTAAILHVEGHPMGTEVWLDGQRLGVTPVTSLIPAGRHQLSIGGLGGEGGKDDRIQHQEFVVRPGETRTFRKPAAAESTATSPVARADAQPIRPHRRTPKRRTEALAGFVPTPGELLSEAHRLMVDKRFDQAAQTYEALRQTHPNTPEAKTVLIALARLELGRGAPTRAASLAVRYLDAGGGALSQEARHLEILSMRALKRSDAELRAVTDFLARHPGSVHEVPLRARQSTLAGEQAR